MRGTHRRPFAALALVVLAFAGAHAGASANASAGGAPPFQGSIIALRPPPWIASAEPQQAGEFPHAASGVPAPVAGEPHLGASEVEGTNSGAPHRTQVIYFVPSDRPYQGLDTDGTLRRSAEAMLSWFRKEAGIAPRMARSGGSVSVIFVRGERAADGYHTGSGSYLQEIASELHTRGFRQENTRYLVYAAVPSGSTCGEAFVPGRYATIYLDAQSACGARDFASGTGWQSAGRAEAIAAHEWLHLEGLVPLTAPRHCWLSVHHICTGPLAVTGLDPLSSDILFPFVTGPLPARVLDRDRIDYFDHPWPHENLRSSAWME